MEDDEERLQAARWLTENWYRHPIPRPRWPHINRALHERTDAEGKSPKQVLKEATTQAVFVVLGKAPPDRSLPPYLRWFRNQVSNTICEDFLGPDWRRKHETPRREIPLGDVDPEAEAPVEEEEFGSLLGELAKKGQLSQREEQVVTLQAQGHSGRDIAEVLGVELATVRTFRRRAREKLLRVWKAHVNA